MTVRAENLSVRFADVTAVNNVNCEAAPGRITSVVGPNASGKSTLLRTMIGAERASGGRVIIGEHDVRTLRPAVLATRLAYVPQRPVVSAAFTVREVIELGRYAMPPKTKRIDDAIDRLELNQHADRPFHELSVGQQQRVALARAYAQHERGGALLLDEPTSAMDLRHVRSCARQLRELADAGATIVVVLHDFDLIGGLADDVWLLHEGALVASGPADDVLTPAVLTPVFEVEFERVTAPGGRSWLVADPLSAHVS